MKSHEKEVDILVEQIKNSEIYKNYLHILEQVEASIDINLLIKDIKALQQKAVKEESLNHNIEAIEDDINTKKDALYNMPLYKDYLEISEELNEVIVGINLKMQKYIDDITSN
ncbi:MAG: YlbF family regulator [Bacilli bacterium]|nr:YlbF family regulator [Bacilli bacterium]